MCATSFEMRTIESLGLNFLFMGQSLYKNWDTKPASILFLISHQFPSLFLSSLLDTPCTYLEKYWRVRDLWWQAKYWAGTYLHYTLFSKKRGFKHLKNIHKFESSFVNTFSWTVLGEKGLNSQSRRWSPLPFFFLLSTNLLIGINLISAI